MPCSFTPARALRPATVARQPDDAELAAIASETYVFLYPLVTMDLTRRQGTNIERASSRAAAR